MRIIHTIPSIESEAAGTSYAVAKLAKSTALAGNDVCVYSLGEPGVHIREGYRDRRFVRDWTGSQVLAKLGLSSTMRAALISSNADIYHAHGLWMLPCAYPAKAARLWNRPLVLSPHGMLGQKPLQISKLKKRIFWAVSQSRVIQHASCIHATSEQEAVDIRRIGAKQPIAVIPIGIDIPSCIPSQKSRKVEPFVLSLGRHHPIKGLEQLIHAWSFVETDFPQWKLKIVGATDGEYTKLLKQLACELKLKSVEFAGPIFGVEKYKLFAQSDLFVLPSLYENFALTVAESLACGTPVIASKGAPWRGLEDNKCGWWIEPEIAPLAKAIRRAISLSAEDRRTMGELGRDWMRRDFAWSPIASKFIDTYNWLSLGAPRPDFVVVD